MMYSFTLWLTPLWSTSYGLVALGAWSVVKLALSFSKQTLLLHNTGLPSFAGVAVWRGSFFSPRVLFLFLPLISFAFFALSVGMSSNLLFAASWLTLPLLYCMPQKVQHHLLVRAWSVSIVSHIVGTFITLVSLPATSWSVLAPMVPAERVVSALGIAAVSYVLDVVVQYAARLRTCFVS